MDLSLVYRKTPAGEEALRERTRLRRSRLRAVLIQVDGQATAGDLCQRLGTEFRPKASLTQLQRLGLIEVLGPVEADVGVADVTPPQPGEALPEIEPKPVPEPEPGPEPELEPEPSPTPEPLPVLAQEVAHVSPPPEPAAVAAPLADAPSPAVEPAQEPVETVTVLPSDLEELVTESVTLSDDDLLTVAPAEAPAKPAADPAASGQPRPVKPRSDWRRHLRRMAAAVRRAMPSFRVTHSKAPAARPRRFSWQVGLAAALGGALFAAGAVVVFFPYERYRGELERQGTVLLGQPVAIERIGLALRPQPGLLLHHVRVGEPELVGAPTVRVLADPLSLVRGDPVLHLIVEKPEIGVQAVSALCSGRVALSGAGGRPRIGSVRFSEGAGSLGGGVFADMKGEVRLSQGQSSAALALASGDDSVRLEIQPGRDGCRLDVAARNWKVAYGGGILLHSLDASGILTERGMQIAKFDARVADGVAEGSGRFDWNGRTKLEIKMDVRRIDLSRLLPTLGIDVAAQGVLDGSLELAAEAPQVGGLDNALAGRGSISVSRGSVSRFDLVEAVRKRGRDATRGGSTRFENLKAQLQFQSGGAVLRNLRVDGGALEAEGNVSVNARNELHGALVAHVRGSAGAQRAALNIGGTLAAPQLVPSAGS